MTAEEQAIRKCIGDNISERVSAAVPPGSRRQDFAEAARHIKVDVLLDYVVKLVAEVDELKRRLP